MFKFLDQNKLKPIGISILLLRGWWVGGSKEICVMDKMQLFPSTPTFENSAQSAETL